MALARALVFNPTALLLDEPLSALDAGLRVELRAQIRSLQREHGITALHVTHDQEEALSMADKIALMHQGRIIQCASPRDMYDRPLNRRVAAFVGHANLWDGTVIGSDRVRVAFGELVCDSSAWPIGAAVTVLVRPERIAIDNKTSDAVNSFAGVVRSDTFLGALRRYELAVAGCDQVLIKGETADRGTVERVCFPPDSIRLLPPDDE